VQLGGRSVRVRDAGPKSVSAFAAGATFENSAAGDRRAILPLGCGE